jgi:hypothetical protein
VAIQTIVLTNDNRKAELKVRFASLPSSEFWQYGGGLSDDAKIGCGIADGDFNRVAQAVAARLAEKVANRLVDVELVIEPVVPTVTIPDARFIPLVLAIAENASASVEPGPGKVQMITWWRGRTIGIDAIGVGGTVPAIIRANLLSPGFSTRIADWDTGFGLHDAAVAAAACGASIEVLDAPEGAVFRLAVQLGRGTPMTPPERETSSGDEGSGVSGDWLSGRPSHPALPDLLRVLKGAWEREPILA